MRASAALLAALAFSCASAPKPTIFGQVDAVRESARSRESVTLAPQAHAYAEQIRERAERAFDADDVAGAQILGEHAILAYDRAFVLARLATAEDRLAKARSALAKAGSELAELDEQQKRLSAEAEALELRIKVARDAVPLVPNAPAGPEREAARLAAARGLAMQARLLCVATRMLSPNATGLSESFVSLDALDRALDGKPEATPIDDAIRARSQCLAHLTAARRPPFRTAPAAAGADKLLEELSNASLEPSRDDRGVFVTVRGVTAKSIAADAQATLEKLGLAAKANPGFPVLVVVHSRGRGAAEIGVLAASALEAAAGRKPVVELAGARQPVVDPKRKGANARNERIEIVFIAPAG